MAVATTWVPEGFERYRELYPRTPELAPRPDPLWSERFAETWHRGEASIAGELAPRAKDTTVVFVRGFLGRYMPGNLAAPRRALQRLGFDAFTARYAPGGTVERNAALLAQQLRARPSRERLVFCGHSRGGLESLTLLAGDAALAARCDGVALSQTAHGPSFVLESVLEGRHRGEMFPMRRRAGEAMQRISLAAIGERAAGRELFSEAWACLVKRVEGVRWTFPVLQTASWSSQPTAWLDSFHERLREIGPGRAHDGQFFLDDLIWPGLPHVLLPHVDHAQPAMGGRGFDSLRYWLALLSLLFRMRGPNAG